LFDNYDKISLTACEEIKMVENGDIIILNNKEVKKLIDKECRSRLGMSRLDFVQQREQGRLPKSYAVHDIEMLLKLDSKR
jgi:hypothetical protein